MNSLVYSVSRNAYGLCLFLSLKTQYKHIVSLFQGKFIGDVLPIYYQILCEGIFLDILHGKQETQELIPDNLLIEKN